MSEKKLVVEKKARTDTPCPHVETDAKRKKVKWIELFDHKVIEPVLGNLNKTTRVGSQMSPDLETLMIEFLRENVDVFA